MPHRDFFLQSRPTNTLWLKQYFRAYRGDTVSFSFTLANDQGPVSLTGLDTLTFTLRAGTQSPVIIEKGMSAFALPPGDAGEITCTLLASDTQQLEPHRAYLWDVEANYLDGRRFTAAKGRMSVLADITHEPVAESPYIFPADAIFGFGLLVGRAEADADGTVFDETTLLGDVVMTGQANLSADLTLLSP